MPIKKTVVVKGTVSYSSEFAITITLMPAMYHMDVVMQRNAIQGIVNTLSQDGYAKLSLCCEMTQHYNVHLHGFIKIPINERKQSPIIKQIVDIFRQNKDIGHVCVRPIEDDEVWFNYCLKEYRTTKLCLEGQDPIIIDDCGRFSPLFIKELMTESSD